MDKLFKRNRRHFKIRKHIIGTTFCPRLSVFRSNRYIVAQVIDDSQGKTLAFVTDMKMEKGTSKTERAFLVGKKLAEQALKKGIKEVVFDRGGFLYHGRIARLAEGAREGGLKL